MSVAFGLALALLAGCQGSDLAPCDAEERRPHRSEIEQMDAALRDSIASAFSGRDRIQHVDLRQEACHFRAKMRVDSFVTRQYATDQGLALVRVLKTNAPNETGLLRDEDERVLGYGIYDYAVTIREVGSDTTQKPLMEMSKHYDARRVHWMQ